MMHWPHATKYLGLAAAAGAWAVIITCWLLNPWFVFTRDAFSDFGGPGSSVPWLYNYGLITVAALVLIYGIYLVSKTGSKIEVVASSFIIVSSIFLAMIGIFHEGTYPHVFVSTWFFIQFGLAILTFGIGLTVRRRKVGIILVLLFALGASTAVLISWPSAATIEAWEILIIDSSVVLLSLEYR
jgi:hypothetical membrane protein